MADTKPRGGRSGLTYCSWWEISTKWRADKAATCIASSACPQRRRHQFAKLITGPDRAVPIVPDQKRMSGIGLEEVITYGLGKVWAHISRWRSLENCVKKDPGLVERVDGNQ